MGRAARSLMLSISLQAGEQVALEGASSSGKNTLLHLIAGVLTPGSGHIAVSREEIAALGETGRGLLRASAESVKLLHC